MAKSQVKSKPKVKLNRKIEVGRWVRMEWDDIGASDGVVVDDNGDGEYTVYTPMENASHFVCKSQIIAVGAFLTAKESGL